ncbi:MAG TPA: tail fiber domain-containing protein, partial [Candidatus Elarobacter sp.]|nr:tail fiber domain-containing protein [Candidatus Elarobacter sp.]
MSDVANGYESFVGAGDSNKACDDDTVIAGGTANVIDSGNGTNATAAFIGAGGSNDIGGSSLYSAIVAGYENGVSAGFAFIGGGNNNTIGSAAQQGVLVGGAYNTVSGQYASVGSGRNNTASGVGASIAAGGYNTASGQGAVIGGGFNSTASGGYATIPGGYVNSAAGLYSFAAGARASAPFIGDFVVSDGSDGDAILAATKAYQFLARASGGVTFWTNAGSTVGATLAPGSGTWASASDRNLKTDVAAVNDASVLDKVDALPISRWSYKSERGVRHVGPMAQDFYAAFKVGEDNTHITSIDEDGVALAAIKALHADNRALHARVGALGTQNAELSTANAGLRARVAALEASERGRDAR